MYRTFPIPDYQKFGLRINPFAQLSSENLETIEEIHVFQDIDDQISKVLSEIIGGKESLAVILIGPLGAGKTQRLRGIAETMSGKGGTVASIKVDSADMAVVTKELFENVWKAIQQKRDVPTRIYKELCRLFRVEKEMMDVQKATTETYHPTQFAEYLIALLKDFPPTTLLIDEIENITAASLAEQTMFIEMLREFISSLPNGCLFIVATTPTAYEALKERFPAFISRFHSEIRIPKLLDDEAVSLVEKRLKTTRIRKIEDPLTPFDELAITEANGITKGNPRKLLRVLRDALAVAAREKDVTAVDEEYVKRFTGRPRTIEDYYKRVPVGLKEDVQTIVEKFKGGPVGVSRVAKARNLTPKEQYERLEHLIELGILTKERVHYKVPESVEELLAK